jgi:hypothetical protein
MPGDNVEMECDLIFDLAMDVGSRYVCHPFRNEWYIDYSNSFTLREGNRTSKFGRLSYMLACSDLLCSRHWYCDQDPGDSLDGNCIILPTP